MEVGGLEAFGIESKAKISLSDMERQEFIDTITEGLCQNESFDAAPLRCVRISKMQGSEDETDRSLLM